MLRKLLNRLAGEANDNDTPSGEAEIAARESYKTFELRAAPMRDGKVWRVAGSVLEEGAAEEEAQPFVRADTCASHDDAVAISLRKARQIANEQAAMAARGKPRD